MRKGSISSLFPGDHAGLERLPEAILELSRLRDPGGVARLLGQAARELTGADGVTFILREGDHVRYEDEDAVAPLWKGQRFPAAGCNSGYAILNGETVVIEDVLTDPRAPREVYGPTFVRSLAILPLGRDFPFGALGAYWAKRHRPGPEELRLLEALAGTAAASITNAWMAEELRRAERARDELLDNAAHELRTPLTPLRIQVDALARAIERGADARRLGQAVERLHEGLDRLERLVEGLEVPRASAVPAWAGGQGGAAPVDLVEVVRDVVGRLETPLRESGSRLILDAPEAVPGPWDRRRIDEVIGHLLSNAIRFGAGEPIEVRVRAEPGRARLVVRDRGIGIAPADRDRIFERFERAVSSREYGGLGLGLWQSRRIVQGQGGALALESEPGLGSTFTVSLPR